VGIAGVCVVIALADRNFSDREHAVVYALCDALGLSPDAFSSDLALR
jgi:tellurite resistance protein